jgi:hypothetical protein
MLQAVNIANALLQHPKKTVDFSNLCVSLAGGWWPRKARLKHWLRVTGSHDRWVWGMSETRHWNFTILSLTKFAAVRLDCRYRMSQSTVDDGRSRRLVNLRNPNPGTGDDLAISSSP